MHLNKAQYRPDIDGLRAIAVLSVVVFHAFPDVLPGGFVGVDIFFVISGYLISGIMFRELQLNTFSFSSFYARRVKRIFPALLVVMAFTFAVGWFVFFKDELRQLGGHMVRAVVFLSNFLLWKDAGYFDSAAETKPLLHLWSLAIEEQFYIIWPLLVWCIWRVKRHRLRWMLVLLAASFVWNLYQSQRDLIHDFYSPLTRFWELLIGAVLAAKELSAANSTHSRNVFDTGWRAPVVSGLALLLLLASLVLIDSSKAFPGAWALLPVGAAALFIAVGTRGVFNRLVLSSRGLVWIGLISFPLYLWHWPILSIGRIVEGGTPSVHFRIFAVVVSVFLAWATYAFIEKPIRYSSRMKYKTQGLVLGMLVIGFVGYTAYVADGYPLRRIIKNQQEINTGDIGHAEFNQYLSANYFPCENDLVRNDALKWGGQSRCFQSKKNRPVDVVLIGDSHSEHLYVGVADELQHLNVAYYLKMAIPLLSVKDFSIIFQEVLGDQQINTVMISAQWQVKAENLGEQQLRQELDRTVKALIAAGKKVYVTEDVTKFDFDPQRCKYQRPFTDATKCEVPVGVFRAQYKTYGAALQSVKDLNPEMDIVRFEKMLCDHNACHMAVEGGILYRDTNHLNLAGSRFVAKKIFQQYPQWN